MWKQREFDELVGKLTGFRRIAEEERICNVGEGRREIRKRRGRRETLRKVAKEMPKVEKGDVETKGIR
uniref:Reverse transcriptase domain-containing protein n=1 Tax=Ascaris lumbricoides TaxID=6252 RepID=A0A0M3I0F7_ASCLU